MKLITEKILQKLIANGRTPGMDHVPVVKLFTPFANSTWLLTEINPDDHDLAFGLFDLGVGFPQLGYIYLPEIDETFTDMPLHIERDKKFVGKYPISVYVTAARRLRKATEDEEELAATSLKHSLLTASRGKKCDDKNRSSALDAFRSPKSNKQKGRER